MLPDFIIHIRPKYNSVVFELSVKTVEFVSRCSFHFRPIKRKQIETKKIYSLVVKTVKKVI